MMCKSPLCTSLGWGRPGRQPQGRGEPPGMEGWGGGGHLLPVGCASGATLEEPGRCFSLGVPRREPSSPSSSHQPATLDMVSRLWGAWAPCTQPSTCKATNKISLWRQCRLSMDKGMAPLAFNGLGTAQTFKNEEGEKAAPHNLPLAVCARAIPEQATHL